MFDTHAHLNFKAFQSNFKETFKKALQNGVSLILVPGTDLGSSKKASEIATANKQIYAAVGIHPHHADEQVLNKKTLDLDFNLFLANPKVVALGEVGLDYFSYQKTKHANYKLSDDFKKRQKKLFTYFINLAVKHKKSLIIHNREATDDTLSILTNFWNPFLKRRVVFHCSEPEKKLLAFALKHEAFIGVDGDVTFNEKKAEFIKTVPLEKLVVETDAPFLLPEPLRSQKLYPNTPANIVFILQKVAEIKKLPFASVVKTTTDNAKELFNIP